MLHASVIMFSLRVWGVGSHVSLWLPGKQVPLAESAVQTCLGYNLVFLADAFLPFLTFTYTLFSHISLQPFQDLGKAIRKVLKSFLILWNGSGFRAKLFLHLFLLKIWKEHSLDFLSFSFSFFFCIFFSICVHRKKKAGFWNPECQILSQVLYACGLTGLELPCWLRSEIHPIHEYCLWKQLRHKRKAREKERRKKRTSLPPLFFSHILCVKAVYFLLSYK